MFRPVLSFPLIALAHIAAAQPIVHQVLVLSEGRYDYVNMVQAVPVSLGSYDPLTGVHATQVTIPDARFANDVKVENEIVYVSADSFLLKYDANTFALLDQAIVPGIRRLALWNDQILITRGEVGGLPHYFEVRDKNDFDLLYAITPADGLIHSCEPVEVIGDKAYLGVNNGFDWPNYTNTVGVVDLIAQDYLTEIDLGPDGFNPEHLMQHGGSLYAFNNKDYTGSSVSRIDPAGASLVYTNNVAYNSGCGTSAVAADKIYYMEYSVNQLARYDLASAQVVDTLTNGISAYGTLGDPINNVLYVTTTDYVSSGALYVTQYDGTVLDSTPVGVASGKLALDLRMSTGARDIDPSGLLLAPNPASDRITVRGATSGTRYDVVDLLGRSVLAGELTEDQRLEVSGMKTGVYTLRLFTTSGTTCLPLVKQ